MFAHGVQGCELVEFVGRAGDWAWLPRRAIRRPFGDHLDTLLARGMAQNGDTFARAIDRALSGPTSGADQPQEASTVPAPIEEPVLLSVVPASIEEPVLVSDYERARLEVRLHDVHDVFVRPNLALRAHRCVMCASQPCSPCPSLCYVCLPALLTVPISVLCVPLSDS